MSSFFEAIAIIIGVLLVMVFSAAVLVTIILLAILTCATVVVTSPFWLLVALLRPQLFKGVVHAAMR